VTDDTRRLPSTVMTVTEAAERLGIERRNVQYHLDKGNLTGRKVGPIWVIPRSQVERMLANRHGAKPGPKPARLSIVESPTLSSAPNTGRARSARRPVVVE
jgi:excisionase family DNA binding protein